MPMFRLAAATVLALLALCAPASADFPWRAGDPHDPTTYRLPAGPGQQPADLSGNEQWMYAATPEPGNEPVNSSPMELHGIRGSRLVDGADVPTAWQTTTGRPDVVIAVHDSGIEWDNRSAMRNLRRKVWLNKGELPHPQHDRSASLEDGQDCSSYADAYDANGDGVFNVVDYSCDSRVQADGSKRAIAGNGVDDLLDPQDVLIAFSDATDADANGYVDDIVGWDFLDDDNDPYDDVQYGHGTGEAQDSTAEADNGQAGVGSCPNCMVMPLRVGDSFIADVNHFAQAAAYATDNGASVVQEALGTLNNSLLARQAVGYARRHGVTVIASAADEAAQHHNWPSTLPGVIVVNSVTRYDETFTPQPRSYLQFNGCTNFSSKITIAIPSVSCSSDATGRASGMAGLVYSAARNAHEEIAPDQVRALLADTADDVDFSVSEVPCKPLPTPACTDPNANMQGNLAVISPLAQSRRYPARRGFDQFYGYGRANLQRAVADVAAHRLPPSVAIDKPEWYDQVDPGAASFDIRATIDAAGAPYTCRVLVAPGSYPGDAVDFTEVPSSACDGSSARSAPLDGVVASVDVAALKALFPPPTAEVQESSGRPNTEPKGFTIKVVVTSDGRSADDRRNLYLDRDPALLPGWPRRIGGRVGGDVEASPVLADLDGDNRNELIVTGSDGQIHALRRDGSELPGWPARTEPLPAAHRGAPAFSAAGGLDPDTRAAVLASPAVADLDRDGVPEVVVADLEGRVSVYGADGTLRWRREADPDFSGRPLSPFAPERHGKRNRTEHGFLGSPVVADLDGDGRMEVVAAGMDRHLYAWHAGGTPVDGFPALVVHRTKVAAVDPRSDRIDFNAAAGPALGQGAIVDTPAVGDLDGDGRPEIVVGTNEEYAVAADGGLNTGTPDTAVLKALAQTGVLNQSNGRVYAFHADGSLVAGWPFKIARLFSELLPVVGEGVTGAPVIGEVTCPSGGRGAKVGTIPDGGPAYVLNPDASSCLGEDPDGKPRAMQSDVPDGNPDRVDALTLPAVGHPAFGDVGGGTSLVAPTTGLVRALDLAVNEYQGGEDAYGAWDPSTGQFRAGFPKRVNDLSFLTGPSIGDVGGAPGEELVGGTAYLDLQAFGAGGVSPPGFPKLTGDWTVANPVLGPFGAGMEKDVVSATRDGRIFAYRSAAAACSPSSWPRFHHDDANSGDARRDATLPGRPERARVARGRLRFTAPGDDLMCGRASGYELRVGGAAWRWVDGATPAAPGQDDSLALPRGARGAVSVRAVDDQGNVGRPATVRG